MLQLQTRTHQPENLLFPSSNRRTLRAVINTTRIECALVTRGWRSTVLPSPISVIPEHKHPYAPTQGSDAREPDAEIIVNYKETTLSRKTGKVCDGFLRVLVFLNSLKNNLLLFFSLSPPHEVGCSSGVARNVT